MTQQEAEILTNIRALFARNALTVEQNTKQVSITVNGTTTVIDQSQRNLNNRTTRLS